MKRFQAQSVIQRFSDKTGPPWEDLMRKLIVPMLLVLSTNLFAQVNDDLEVYSGPTLVMGPSSVRIKDIKSYLKTVDPDQTCLDEYLHRRRQLITTLSLSPVIIAGGTLTSTYGAAVATGLAVNAIGSVGMMDALAYVILGAMGGFVSGAGASMTSVGKSSFALADVDLILKALAEQRLNRPGKKSEKLYLKYIRGEDYPLDKDLFFENLLQMDESGALCDGSLVPQPRIKLAPRLKYKVARTRHIKQRL
jgi:hypothetical protein